MENTNNRTLIAKRDREVGGCGKDSTNGGGGGEDDDQWKEEIEQDGCSNHITGNENSEMDSKRVSRLYV